MFALFTLVTGLALADEPAVDASAPLAPAPVEATTDPSASRYFYSPSAFNLGRGHGYISQRELLFTSAGFGVTDWWDVQVGTVAPTLFINDARIGIVGTKVAFPVAPELRLGVGTQAFLLPENTRVGFVFANATLGDRDRNLTVAAGRGLDFASPSDGLTIMTVSGKYQVSPHVALMSENWMIIDDEGTPHLYPSGGVRLFGERFSSDLGFVMVVADSTVVPVPWVDVTWNFGTPRS